MISPGSSRGANFSCASTTAPVIASRATSTIAPPSSRELVDPVREVTPLNGALTSAAATPAASKRASDRNWVRCGATTTSVTRPAAHANSAPREKLRYRPAISVGAAPAAAARSHSGRSASPANLAASTNPIAASTPIAFQYVSGCSSRPWALTDLAKCSTPGTSRSESPYPITISTPAPSPGSTARRALGVRSSAAAASSTPRYSSRRCPSWYAVPVIGAHAIEQSVHAASSASPSVARSMARPRGSGAGNAIAATATRTQATIAAVSWGPSK